MKNLVAWLPILAIFLALATLTLIVLPSRGAESINSRTAAALSLVFHAAPAPPVKVAPACSCSGPGDCTCATVPCNVCGNCAVPVRPAATTPKLGDRMPSDDPARPWIFENGWDGPGWYRDALPTMTLTYPFALNISGTGQPGAACATGR